MKIGILTIELYLSQVNSLKGKRFTVSRLKDKIRNKFNVSVIESDYQDKWQRSVLAAACISNDDAVINSTFDRILNLVESEKQGYEILNQNIEII